MKTEKLKDLWSLAFGDEEDFIDCFFSTAYAPDRCRYLTEGEALTAALYWLDTAYAGRKYAYVYGVATHPEHRGKGFCRCLMEQTHEVLAARGYAGVLLVPAKPGLRKMYGKLGYRDCSTLSEFACTAGAESVSVRNVSVPEYAALRRQFLPQGGVIQEGENLAYLATYAALYSGDGFLMAAVHEEGRLFVPELLGDKGSAPGILKAMGYEKGTFRVPGEEIPFAMFYPLQEAAPAPSYLGLAFD